MSSVTFGNGLYIGTSIAVNCLPAMSAELPIESLFTIHVRKNDGPENYLPKKKKFPEDSVSLEGVQELGSISWRLPEVSHVCSVDIKILSPDLRLNTFIKSKERCV